MIFVLRETPLSSCSQVLAFLNTFAPGIGVFTPHKWEGLVGCIWHVRTRAKVTAVDHFLFRGIIGSWVCSGCKVKTPGRKRKGYVETPITSPPRRKIQPHTAEVQGYVQWSNRMC